MDGLKKVHGFGFRNRNNTKYNNNTVVLNLQPFHGSLDFVLTTRVSRYQKNIHHSHLSCS